MIRLLKALLNLVPVSLYYLVESLFIGLIASVVWILFFGDVQAIMPFTLTYLKFVSVVWLYKLTKSDLMSISLQSLPQEENVNNNEEEN